MKAIKLKSKWLMLACLAMMCGCSDDSDEGTGQDENNTTLMKARGRMRITPLPKYPLGRN